jgi:hypothetical protein
MRLVTALVVAACACGRPPAKPVVAAPPSRPAPVTCSDAGVLLRGRIETDAEAAGRAREVAIAEACTTGKWSQAVVDCVASEIDREACLDKLTHKQRALYDQHIAAWNEKHGLVDHDSDHVPYIVACADVIGDPARYGPALGENAPERAWTLKVREAELLEHCDHDWDEDVKNCVEAAPDAGSITTCLSGLDQPDELTKRFAELERVAGKMAASRKKPATIGCKQVVAAHYGDKEWKTKLDGFKAKLRKQMIVDSRKTMTAACTAENWDETLRACIVAGGGETCFKSFALGMKWGYPAAGVVVSVGVAECDAYGAAVAKIAACDKLPQQSRDALRDSYQQMQAQVASLPAAERASVATSCKAGLDAIEQIVTTIGC